MNRSTSSFFQKGRWWIWGILIAIFACGIAFFCVRMFRHKQTDNHFGKSKSNWVLSVDNDTYAVEDLMYYIYSEEEMGALYDEVYLQFYGESYWDMEDEENNNLTGRQIARKNIINNAKLDAVFYQEALKAGYSLTENDKADAKKNYDSFVKSLSKEQKNAKGMKEELLTYFEHQALIDQYKEQVLDESEFDYEQIEASVSKEDCRQYDYEVYMMDKTDDNGELYDEAVLADMKNTLETLRAKLESKTNMEKLLNKINNDSISYSAESLVVADVKEESGYGAYNGVDVDLAIMSLKNGEISSILETEDSFMVVRMKNNNSKENYNDTCKEKIENAKNKIFNATYKKVKSQYNIQVNKKVLHSIELGYMIYQ